MQSQAFYFIFCSVILLTYSQTFINNAPLTKGTEELKHGDSLRFGYGTYIHLLALINLASVHICKLYVLTERSHVFRVEENFQKRAKSMSPTLHPLPTSTATQTSPQTNVQVSGYCVWVVFVWKHWLT